MVKELNNRYIFFLQILLDYLSKVELDPISIEVQIMRLFKDKQLIKLDQVYDYTYRLSTESKMVNFNPNDSIMIISPNKLSKLKEFIKYKLIEFDNSTSEIEAETQLLIKLLREKYENAPKGYQMTMVHLFGIENSEKLIGKDLKLISIRATGLESLYVEINKGMKLSKYVKPMNIE